MANISRKDLLQNVRLELYCTIGSVGRPVGESSLIGLFREDCHGEDLIQFARGLGYVSIEAMLRSEEFADIIEVDFSSNALGVGHNNEPIICYTVKPKPRTAHLLKTFTNTVRLREEHAEKYKRASVIAAKHGHPAFDEAVIEGRMFFLRFLDSLSAYRRKGSDAVQYNIVQELYQTQYGTVLNPAELKRLFNKNNLTKICTNILYDDVELLKNNNKDGDVYLKMKRPLEEIEEEYYRVLEQRAREEEERQRREEERARQSEAELKKRKKRSRSKKRNNLGQDEFQQIQVRPLTPEYEPDLVPVALKQEKLHTPFPHIGRLFGSKGLASKCALGDEKLQPPISSDEDSTDENFEENFNQRLKL